MLPGLNKTPCFLSEFRYPWMMLTRLRIRHPGESLHRHPPRRIHVALNRGKMDSRLKHSGMTLILLFFFAFLTPSFAIPVSSTQTPEQKALAQGFSAFMDGQDKVALSYFEEVLRINPRNSAAKKGQSKVKARLRKKDDVDRAKSHHLARSKMKEGNQLLSTKDIVNAIDAYHEALDVVPRYSPAEKKIRHIRSRMDRVVKSKKFNLSDWAFARGVIAYLDRDWAKAYRIWSERHQVDPQNVALANATVRAENKFKNMMVSEQEEFFRRGGRAFYAQGYYLPAKSSWDKVLSLRPDDLEALEGRARAEEAYLRAVGKGRDSEFHDLLEKGIEYYASQNWTKALETFKILIEKDPNLTTAQEYVAKINQNMATSQYVPTPRSGEGGWKDSRSSSPAGESIRMPSGSGNYAESIRELESQLKRDPSNIRTQQELDKVKKLQEDDCERIYKDGLIAYSQGNRQLAMDKWKQVLLLKPDHGKAEAALRKARAEEERSVKDEEKK